MSHFDTNEVDERTKLLRSNVLAQGMTFDESKYEYSDRFKEATSIDFHSVHTMPELAALLAKDDKIELTGKVLEFNKSGETKYSRINRDRFLETWKRNSKLKEGYDSFGTSNDGYASNKVGDDYVPLLGGPFNKQLYLYDSLRMFSLAFHAYHHDPVARMIIHTIKQFSLGRGFRVDCKNRKALAQWRAFEKVNDLQKMMDNIATELPLNGEVMLWWLPGDATKITWQLATGQTTPTGCIPRVRLSDPSTCWEIVTYPEDMTRILYYQFVFPTQYQIYTGTDGGSPVPSSKFIMQQIKPDDMMHFKINCMSNEKRGRSELFPVLGYLKRLRDSVNYSIVAMQKSAAWAIDTTIEGSQADLQGYVDDQNSQGSIAPAGSEFVHTDKIKRQYLANEGGGSKDFPTFEWCLNMIAMGVGIPVSYFGIHSAGGGSTRAGAMVGTEPVTKKFQFYQLQYERIIQAMWDEYINKRLGMDADCEVTFPELLAQDRTAKLKDLSFSEEMRWITHERAATLAAKELGITEYEYDEEEQDIDSEVPEITPNSAPLTAPGLKPLGSGDSGSTEETTPPTAVTSADRRAVSRANGR